MWITIALILVVVAVSLWLRWRAVVNSGSGPMARGSLPILGYSHKLLGNTEKLYHVVKELSHDSLANGGVSRIIIAFETYYVVTDPEDLLTVGNNALKKHFAFEFAKSWLGEGLIVGPPSVWRNHRKLLNPSFSVSLLHGFLATFNSQARELVDQLSAVAGGAPLDLVDYAKKNAMGLISQTTLGLSKQTHTDLLEEYTKAADEMLEMVVTRFQNVWLHSDLVYWLAGLKKKEAGVLRALSKLSDVVIKAKRSQIEDVSKESETSHMLAEHGAVFLERLLQLSARGALTDEEVKDEVDNILVAGVDTFAWVMTFVCAALGTYPQVQQKVFYELNEIFGDSERDVAKDDLPRLVYLEAVIKETLRLYPIGLVSVRTVEHGFQLKKQYLRPGDHVVMSFYGVNRHAAWGPDADRFRAERWLEGNSVPSAFAGFGVGKRNCVGKTYAIMSMKVSLCHVLRRYRVAGDVTQIKFKMDFVVKAVSGHHVALSERRHHQRHVHDDGPHADAVSQEDLL